MLFSRIIKNKHDKQNNESELDQETIARWKSIAAESKGEQEYKTIELSDEAALPDTKSYSESSPNSEQLSFSTSTTATYEEQSDRTSWPSNSSLSSFGESPEPDAHSFEAQGFQEAEEDLEEEPFMEAPVEDEEVAYNPVQQTTPQTQSVVPRADLSLPAEEDIKRRFGDNIRSALGPGTVIDGTFRFDNPVCVNGTLTGEVVSSSALIVGSQAIIEASVIVGSLIVQGTVLGDVEADDLVEMAEKFAEVLKRDEL